MTVTLAVHSDRLQPMNNNKNEFEIRIDIVKHISAMLLEMSEVGDSATDAEIQIMLEDFEEVADHILGALALEIKGIDDDGVISASMKLMDIEKYIEDLSDEDGV